jgi:hypothetical protein
VTITLYSAGLQAADLSWFWNLILQFFFEHLFFLPRPGLVERGKPSKRSQ